WIQRLGGVGDWKIDLELIADYTPADTWLTLYAVLGVVAECIFLPNTGTPGPANPEFTGNAILGEIPVGGAFGELGTFNVTFEGSGALGVAYA
ncbi:MAG: phage tail protein, partial [Dehalococcoidia bacterium]|nr:phage tail protein [Dehalococcoidia bacterium]